MSIRKLFRAIQFEEMVLSRKTLWAVRIVGFLIGFPLGVYIGIALFDWWLP